MSFYDDELKLSLDASGVSYGVLPDEVHDRFVREINSRFKFVGGKIDWNNFIEAFCYSDNGLVYGFERVAENLLSASFDEIYCIGDSLVDCAYRFSVRDMGKVLLVFSEIPQHTYFFSEDFSWISCLSMEGTYEGGMVNGV